ncbi:phage tail protein [Agromyces ramosus]|uniref:Phage-related protein n=1 Tax=Agromyces ramosus TaxID=33879 RepID=A0ABU0R716_9MICO|nr:hypothetical protein [Agromyces ramosus]MDQ0893880.1 hypothetical protein [Agromyces ramosus]
MAGAQHSAIATRAAMTSALTDGRQRTAGAGGRASPRETGGSGGSGGPAAMLALQRSAGNAAVSALMAAKLKWPGDEARVEIDAAIREVKRDEPEVDTVEKGLKEAKAVGIPVDLEGVKPPASALSVTRTGFGPGSVPPKKPVPPPKPVPAVSPLGKAAAAKPKLRGAAAKGAGGASVASMSGAIAAAAAPVPLTADKLLLPPVAPPGVKPAQDPAFAQVTGSVKGFASAKRAHPPAASKAKEAQDAAVPPTDDIAGQAKAAKADSMDAQQPGSFDKKAFIAAVKAAIEAKSPKTLKEADDYAESGKAGEVKGEVKGLVTQGKEGSAKDIETATEAPPDQSKAVAKPVTPMPQEDPGQVAPIPAAGAVPKTAPPEQVNLEAGKHEVGQEMTDAHVTDEQLAKSGEPSFQGALADKRTAAEHADTAPGEYRQQEQATIAQGKVQAGAATAAGVQGMQGAKGAALAKLVADKGKAKSKDEQKRAEVTAKIQGIFNATEADVKKILEGLDPKVEAEFERGEAGAKAAFESYVAAKMSAYKKDRYGGWLGGIRWAKDKLFGMPDKVNEFYEAGRELYLAKMDGVISRVADIVAADLTAAKQRIAKGRAEIASYVKSLPQDLQKVGSEAATEIGDRFEQLESDVKDKENEVVQTLATKYVEARKGLDERIEALQAENKGLVDKAIGAIKAVINTIRELASMLANVLARAASVIGDIIGDPVGFLGNLISGIKGGIDKFFANITTHLKKGLMGWLFGQLGDAGIEIPDTFDLKGVVKLLASVFGLTWANIRNRIVLQIGEKAMAAVEKGVEIFQVMKEQGVAGLWDKLVEKVGDIKDMILTQLEDFVITKIITAGITWLISLLNPAAAFIKACKLIYDVVMFFVNNAARIAQFVNTVIDGVVDIAKGNVSAVVDKIESALGQMVPILIGFIASVLGIGGIGEKIRSIVQALQKPVNKALDFVIKTGLKLAGPIIRAAKGISAKVKAKVESGRAWVKGKAEAGKAWAKGKVAGAGEAIRKLKDRMLGIAFRQEFEANGEKHSVYSKKGAPELLYTASTPQPSAQAAPTPTVRELEARYRATIRDYVATVRTLDASPQDAAAKARAEGLKDQAAALFRQLVDATTAFVTTSGRKSRGEPVGPAPGIGTIGMHGAKPPSNRGGHRLHWTESEHVIPFAVGKSVWAALKQYMPWRGSRADNRQTTIMIYERAARIKTPADNAMSYTIKNLLVDSRIVENISRGRVSGQVGLSDRDADDALARIQGAVETARKDAVSRTIDAIRAENEMKEGGAAKTNGERRGNEPPSPASGLVEAAARQQYDNIMDLVRQEVMHEASVKEKAERLELTPRGRRR